jgi:hypothetical protein
MMVVQLDWLALIRELLGTCGLKEGAVVAVGEQPPQREKPNNLQEGERS